MTKKAPIKIAYKLGFDDYLEGHQKNRPFFFPGTPVQKAYDMGFEHARELKGRGDLTNAPEKKP